MKCPWLLLLLLAPWPLALVGCGQPRAKAEATDPAPALLQVDMAAVSRGRLETTLDLVGTLIPIRATTIVSDVDGTILLFPLSDHKLELEQNGQRQSVSLVLDIGQPVRAGDVLVQIDRTDFELAAKIAQANLELARRNLEDLKAWKRPEEIDSLRAALAEARAASDRGKADLERSQQLVDRKMISDSTYDGAFTDAAMTGAKLKQAEAALKIAEAGPTAEQVAVVQAQVDAAGAELKLREEKLRKTAIVAPYDGVISERYVDVGERVTAMPRVEIMQLIDPRILFAQVAVPERYQAQVHLGDAARVTGAGIGGVLPGRVDLINAKVDPETRSFRIRVTVDNREGMLKAGGFVNVALPVESADNVVLAPLDAVTFSEGQPAVFVYESGRVKKTPVQLGISNREVYEIVSGVDPGQQIAVTKTALLADGLQVQPKPPAVAVEPAPAPRRTAHVERDQESQR